MSGVRYRRVLGLLGLLVASLGCATLDLGGCGSLHVQRQEIRDIDDLARVTADFLCALALGDRRLTDLRVRTIPPNAHGRSNSV